MHERQTKREPTGQVWNPERVQSQPQSNAALFTRLFIWAVVLVSGLMAWGYFFTPETERIAREYNVPKDKVIIVPKPHGCDFGDAPFGNKHCHFEKVVNRETRAVHAIADNAANRS